jgi:hypothetical protein
MEMWKRQVQVMCGPAGSCGEIDYAHALARWARAELLKEKVKQRMEAKHGKDLDRLADLVVEMVEEQAREDKELEQKREKLRESFESMEDGGE